MRDGDAMIIIPEKPDEYPKNLAIMVWDGQRPRLLELPDDKTEWQKVEHPAAITETVINLMTTLNAMRRVELRADEKNIFKTNLASDERAVSNRLLPLDTQRAAAALGAHVEAIKIGEINKWPARIPDSSKSPLHDRNRSVIMELRQCHESARNAKIAGDDLTTSAGGRRILRDWAMQLKIGIDYLNKQTRRMPDIEIVSGIAESLKLASIGHECEHETRQPSDRRGTNKEAQHVC